MKRILRRRTIIISLLLTLVLAGTVFTAGRALDYMEVVDTYWRVHDEVLQPTEAGRYYIDLFWRQNTELCSLILQHAQVKDDALPIILQFEPGLRALVDGEGENVRISDVMVERIQAYLDLLVAVGSPELGAAIQAERDRTSLDQFKGMSFEQARIMLVGLPVGPVPTPIDADFPREQAPTPFSTSLP